MNSYLLGAIVGITLAVLNFLGSSVISSKIIFGSKLTSVALALGGFIIRLTILGLLFYGLSNVKGIHFQTALVSFIFCFTVCLIFRTMRFYREFRSFPLKRTEG